MASVKVTKVTATGNLQSLGLLTPRTANSDNEAAPDQYHKRRALVKTTSLPFRLSNSPAKTPALYVLTITYFLSIVHSLSICLIISIAVNISIGNKPISLYTTLTPFVNKKSRRPRYTDGFSFDLCSARRA
jgi:hypothetical protein